MAIDDPDAEDRLLERLKQSVSSDDAVRQLRRRYNLLRNDYELLIDRLGQLEDRLAAAQPASEPVVPVRLPGGPQPAEPAPDPAGHATGLDLTAPLLRLRDEYLSAASSIQAIVSGLDSLAAAAFKGQHPPALARAEEADTPAERPHLQPARIPVAVKGSGFGQLLDFQEHLSALPGVARVSINAIDNERASLVVELDSDSAPI